MISVTKIDESFPKGNFLIEGFSTPCRLGRDSKGRGIMLYVRADIWFSSNGSDSYEENFQENASYNNL